MTPLTPPQLRRQGEATHALPTTHGSSATGRTSTRDDVRPAQTTAAPVPDTEPAGAAGFHPHTPGRNTR